MSSNILIKGLALTFIGVVIFLVLQAAKSGDSASPTASGRTTNLVAIESGPSVPDNGLAIDPLQDDFLSEEFGVDVDSPVETMRTLTNETRAVREDSLKLQEKNRRLNTEVERLLAMEKSLTKTITNRADRASDDVLAKQTEIAEAQNRTMALIANLEQRLVSLQAIDTPRAGATSANGYSINTSDIPSGLGYDDDGKEMNFDEVVWTTPIDAEVDPRDPSNISLPVFSLVPDNLPSLATTTAERKQQSIEERSIKAYTIPINGTLIGSVSMTAMLGRIPINGQVTDPYPFKVMVGQENLASNGIKIPGVTGITMSGVAKGDWTLSCVSGDITSMTFTFQDGTIKTIPEPGTRSPEPIAWFSDRNGIPCITGKRITNAVSYLSQRVALTAASEYAQARADSQFTVTQNSDGDITSGLTGNAGTVAASSAAAEGINEVGDWLDARRASSFDAIYVPPGTQLAIHVNEELKIDYDPEGRKVNHYANINRRTDTHLD
jgi:integrating conjugative element protein (TIGR03752 family)